MDGTLEVTSEYEKGSEFFFTIHQLYADKEYEETIAKGEETFVAPDAKVLVVDDSKVNLKLAVGLLGPLQLQVETAESGEQALEMLRNKKYDLIFMDHMMPGMDGVETTLRLRQMSNGMSVNSPVVAFTANVMKEARESFVAAGMNGFLSKPVEEQRLFEAVRRYLDPQFVIPTKREEGKKTDAMADTEKPEFDLKGIDCSLGINNSGSKEFFIEILEDFCLLIDTKSIKIEKCVEEHLLKEYTIEVHALKSNARIIGATELARQFEMLEKFGREKDLDKIRSMTPEVLENYRSFKGILQPYCQKEEKEKKEASVDEILFYLKGIKDSVEGFDLSGIDFAMEKLEEYQLPDMLQEKMNDLRVLIADVALEDILRMTDEMAGDLSGRK